MNPFIEALNQWSTSLPGFAWQMFWQSSLLIAVIFVFEVAMRRKVRAAIRYGLWIVVLLKLVIPPTLSAPTSVAWWVRSVSPMPPRTEPKRYVVSYSDRTPAEPAADLANVFTGEALQPSPILSWSGWALLISAGCSAGMLAWAIIRWRHVARLVRAASPANESLSRLLAETGQGIRLRVAVKLRLTDQPMSPAVCGMMRPVILLPRSLAEQLPPNNLRAVLLHELSHLKRGDVWVNCLQTLVQIVYWWHPLVWLANARIRRVREEAVDDAVMLALQAEANCYAPTLLEVAKLAFHRPMASLGLVGILESRSALRQRIERLIDFKTPRRAGLSFMSLVGITAFTALAVPMGEAPSRPATEMKPPISTTTSLTGILTDPQFKPVLTALQQRDDVDKLTEGKVATIPGASVNRLSNVGLLADTIAKTNIVNTNDSSPFNPRTVHISPARQAIMNKLDKIRLDRVIYDGLPLSEVIRSLSQITKRLDPDGRGINFLINAVQPVALDSATGLPAVLPQASATNDTDIMNVSVTIKPPLTDARLADVLDAIVKSADKPIKYSIRDYGIEFSPKGNGSLPLSSRLFKMDPNTFLQNIEQSGISTNGVRPMTAILNFFKSIGINLEPPRSFIFNDGSGTLWVRASTEDLDTIEGLIQAMNIAPAQVQVDVKFIEMPKEVADTLTASWFSATNHASGVTAILTAPFVRELLRQLKLASGVKEIFNGAVTTLSGRQAQIQSGEMKSIVVSNQQSGLIETNVVHIGSTLDLASYVGADGYTIGMFLNPEITELFNDDSSQSTHPSLRIRRMTTSANVWDGQTLVLGFTTQNELGFGNAATSNKRMPEDPRRNVLVLITPTIIDPAGNRIHTDEEMINFPGIKR